MCVICILPSSDPVPRLHQCSEDRSIPHHRLKNPLNVFNGSVTFIPIEHIVALSEELVALDFNDPVNDASCYAPVRFEGNDISFLHGRCSKQTNSPPCNIGSMDSVGPMTPYITVRVSEDAKAGRTVTAQCTPESARLYGVICSIIYHKNTKKIVNKLKRLNIVFEDKDFEILQQAKGEDTWAKALIKWAKIVLKDRESQW